MIREGRSVRGGVGVESGEGQGGEGRVGIKVFIVSELKEEDVKRGRVVGGGREIREERKGEGGEGGNSLQLGQVVGMPLKGDPSAGGEEGEERGESSGEVGERGAGAFQEGGSGGGGRRSRGEGNDGTSSKTRPGIGGGGRGVGVGNAQVVRDEEREERDGRDSAEE